MVVVYCHCLLRERERERERDIAAFKPAYISGSMITTLQLHRQALRMLMSSCLSKDNIPDVLAVNDVIFQAARLGNMNIAIFLLDWMEEKGVTRYTYHHDTRRETARPPPFVCLLLLLIYVVHWGWSWLMQLLQNVERCDGGISYNDHLHSVLLNIINTHIRTTNGGGVV